MPETIEVGWSNFQDGEGISEPVSSQQQPRQAVCVEESSSQEKRQANHLGGVPSLTRSRCAGTGSGVGFIVRKNQVP